MNFRERRPYILGSIDVLRLHKDFCSMIASMNRNEQRI